jgi:hypothetical protein
MLGWSIGSHAWILKAENSYFPELLSLVSAIAVLRMGDQRAISALTKLSNFAGVRSSFLGIDRPRSASFALTVGSPKDRSSAVASLVITPFYVPFGAKIPAGQIVLLTDLFEHQEATMLQLPFDSLDMTPGASLWASSTSSWSCPGRVVRQT